MRIGFAGTPAFAGSGARGDPRRRLRVSLVLTRPDRPHGRGMKLEPGPVKALAAARRIPVLQPASLKDAAHARTPGSPPPARCARGRRLWADPAQALLDWPRHGCINIHASLLPRWRGAAPIQRALLAGDAETGVSIMRIDEGLDTGPVIARQPVPIAARETAGSLHDKLAVVGGAAIVEALRQLQREGFLAAAAQARSGRDLRGEDRPRARRTSTGGQERARDRSPDPGLQSGARCPDDARQARRSSSGRRHRAGAASGRPGRSLRADASGIVVACGEGALSVTALQRPGGQAIVRGGISRRPPHCDGGPDGRRERLNHVAAAAI